MAKATTRLTNDALAFLTERHLAMLTTLRSDNSPHVVAVGFTFDPKTHIARVITTGGIHGLITKLSDDTIQLQIADKVRIELARAAVGGYQGQAPVVEPPG